MSDLHKIEVVFEKNGILAVNKPAGLPTQAMGHRICRVFDKAAKVSSTL